jgi:carbonic anhydrase
MQILGASEVGLRQCNAVRQQSRLCDLNVIEQVANVCRTTTLRRAWHKGQRVEVHCLVYGLADGLLRRVGVSANGTQAWAERYRESVQSL